jgi:hypothetical protein
MRTWHPRDVELATLSDQGAEDGGGNHIRLCARCRRVVSEYEWLQVELSGTLEMEVHQVHLPQAQWWEVRKKIGDARNREVARVRASALLSAAMVVSLLLGVPSFIKPPVAAQALQPQISVRPTPIAMTEAAGAAGASLSSRASTPWAASGTGTQQSPAAPSAVPIPSPPECER